jgi:hypothetical protein
MNPSVTAWAPLLPVAMVGTDRQAAPLPAWPGDVGATLAALADAQRPAGDSPDINQPAADVLRAAGILAVCGLAGARAQARPASGRAAAAPDALPVADDPAISHWLLWALRDGPDRVQQLFFQRFAQAGLRLPHALLPTALELGRTSLASRALIQPLLGERGVWLARQNSEWQFAAGIVAADELDPRQWTDGTLEQRKAFLAAERRRDPRAARERLVAALPELPAKERFELARGLEIALGPDDEPLLDQLRADRGQDVRAAAIALIVRLPDAAHPRRAAGRVAALMSRSASLAGNPWTIEPPAAVAPDWKADQVEATVGIANMGERAWWLYQLVRQVPLAWWPAHTGLGIKQLAAWADASEWGEALWMGWRDVLRHAPDIAWAEALLDEWPTVVGPRAVKDKPPRSVLGDREQVLWIVSPEVRERYFEAQLESAVARLAHNIFAICTGCKVGELVSQRLAAPVVQRVKQVLAMDTTPDPVSTYNPALSMQGAIGQYLPLLCSVLPLSFLADFNDWPSSPSEPAHVGRGRHEGRQIIQARRALDAYLP